jgi:hypothetical protein
MKLHPQPKLSCNCFKILNHFKVDQACKTMRVKISFPEPAILGKEREALG